MMPLTSGLLRVVQRSEFLKESKGQLDVYALRVACGKDPPGDTTVEFLSTDQSDTFPAGVPVYPVLPEGGVDAGRRWFVTGRSRDRTSGRRRGGGRFH